MSILNTTQIIVLGGGKGTRMNSDLPKVLVEIAGQAMITRLLENITQASPEITPIVVTGFESEKVEDHLRDSGVVFAHQAQQLGTGHAVQVALPKIAREAENVLVLYGDMPLVSANTICNLAECHEEHEYPLSMVTTKVSEEELEKYFGGFSRVIRGENGDIKETVEVRDASDEQLLIHEVNPAFLYFSRDWLQENIEKLDSNNQQEEFYLTDLIKMAFDQYGTIPSITVNSYEAYGANTPEQLKRVEDILDKKNTS